MFFAFRITFLTIIAAFKLRNCLRSNICSANTGPQKHLKNIRKILRKIARYAIIKKKQKGSDSMAVIKPVSDLRNYNIVLENVSVGSPVYLTVNGRGRYTIRDIAEDEEFEKAKAMLRLMCELNEGRRSGEEEGYMSSEEVRAYFRGKRL